MQAASIEFFIGLENVDNRVCLINKLTILRLAFTISVPRLRRSLALLTHFPLSQNLFAILLHRQLHLDNRCRLDTASRSIW